MYGNAMLKNANLAIEIKEKCIKTAKFYLIMAIVLTMKANYCAFICKQLVLEEMQEEKKLFLLVYYLTEFAVTLVYR
jgi:hypothetical protein